MNSDDQFEAIVSEHYEPLFRFALSLTRAESDAQDLTQQTFYVWATKGHQLRDASKVKTWLYTTLHRAFLGTRRRQIRFSHHELESVSEQLPSISPEFAPQTDAAQVLAALAKVDEVYRAAVALFYLEDYSYQDIAAILEVPMGTVKSRIARGIAQLKDILLPDDSPATTSQPNEISSTSPNAGKTLASPENSHSNSHHRAKAATKVSKRGYVEWDFSSTLLPEQFCFS